MTSACAIDRNQPQRMLQPIVLIVNSDEPARTWIETTVVSAGLPTLSFTTATELLGSFKADTAACAILDVVLSDASGLDLQENLAQAGVSTIVLSREHCISSCVRAVKAGAIDFLTLPCDATELVQALRHAVRESLSSWAQRAQLGELRFRYEQLTARERQVFTLVCSGMLNKQIARRLDITEATVQIHRGRVTRKMAARSLASLVRMADALHLSHREYRNVDDRDDESRVVGFHHLAGNTLPGIAGVMEIRAGRNAMAARPGDR